MSCNEQQWERASPLFGHWLLPPHPAFANIILVVLFILGEGWVPQTLCVDTWCHFQRGASRSLSKLGHSCFSGRDNYSCSLDEVERANNIDSRIHIDGPAFQDWKDCQKGWGLDGKTNRDWNFQARLKKPIADWNFQARLVISSEQAKDWKNQAFGSIWSIYQARTVFFERGALRGGLREAETYIFPGFFCFCGAEARNLFCSRPTGLQC